MTHTFSRAAVRALARLSFVLCGTAAALPAAHAECGGKQGAGPTPNRIVYSVSAEQSLVAFKSCQPGKLQPVGPITGLGGADTAVVGLDFRVQDGLLYALGNGGGIYTVDVATGAATLASQLTTALDGSRFAMDFNPAANALRIVSDSGQNLRHPFAMPEPRITLVDPVLNYTPGVPAAGVAGIGYTNNDLDANTGTTLVDIDASLNQVVLQAPANNGSLNLAGKLGVDPDSAVGFDIHSRKSAGAAVTNVGFASMNVGGVAQFYRVDLLTGRATMIGALAKPLVDIAVTLDP